MKKVIAAIAALTLMMPLAGCGQKEVDATKVATELLNNASFAETLTEVNEQVTKKRLDLDDDEVIMCAAFKGTSAVVDEIIVIKTTDPEDVEEKLYEYVDSQTEQYESYRPSEVPKLEDSLITVEGDTVIYCASEDSVKAMEIITENTSK